jgi:hypothetical protein
VAAGVDSAYTEPMKRWAKLVACFLIAWLPLLGYPAQVALCPEMSSPVMHPEVQASDMSDMAAHSHDAKARVMRTRPGCHSSLGGLACGAPILPATHTTAVVPSSPVYRAVSRVLVEQFIPELPAPPPRSI